VDGTGSVSCPVACFRISNVEPAVSATRMSMYLQNPLTSLNPAAVNLLLNKEVRIAVPTQYFGKCKVKFLL
jgi:hypothetical protein